MSAGKAFFKNAMCLVLLDADAVFEVHQLGFLSGVANGVLDAPTFWGILYCMSKVLCQNKPTPLLFR